ncbi:MAG: alanyl-tRNA editing protein [Oscillospiraceae bacterium]|jgi:alanyl-tRNA synthetase
MKTELLFYQDTYLQTFSATVRSCVEKSANLFAIVLDRTAFYPEGGGQPGDTGTLNGFPVVDTQEVDGNIVHLCTMPLAPGTSVTGEINWSHRFDLMQQHSGEHLVSGLIHKQYGYDNVGFHLGSDRITIDFNGELDEAGLRKIERLANEAVWADIATEITYPTPEELELLDYRSKKELTGSVRIVAFRGIDTCACCGTHVRRTGEIGPIQLVSCTKFRDGVRIELLCGKRALTYTATILNQNAQISALLSAKVGETAAAVQRLQQELSDTRSQLAALEKQLFAEKAAKFVGKGDVLLFEEGLSADSVRRLTDAILETCGGRCAVFSGDDTNGYKYAIGEQDGNLRDFVKLLNNTLHGRGGGKPFFVQGSVTAKKAEITAFFHQ